MIVLSAGHHPQARGAANGSFTEYPETAIWAGFIARVLTEKYFTECVIVPTGTLPEKVKWIKELHAKVGVQIAVEIHFNSVAGGGAKGAETLYYPGSVVGKRMAVKVQEAMAEFTTDRGIKEGWYKMDRPGIIDFYGDEDGDETPDYFLRKTPCPALIIEPEFIQNQDWIEKHRHAVSEALAEAIYEAVEDESHPTPRKRPQ